MVGTGITSALGDVCYETTTVILPGFFAVLGLPAAVLGTIEGISDAVASFTKMISGFIADKLDHRKLLVIVGYGLTPIGQMMIAMAGGWPLILSGRMISWFGKGLCGPLRDAIVIQAVRAETRGRAFGFHRAADTVGAVLGPMLGVALLGWAQVAGLLYVWRNVVQVAVSFPVGILADRFGHLPVLVAGYVLGALTAILTAAAFWLSVDSILLLGVIFFIAGLYVAVQEALESTVTASMVGKETLALSIGALGTVNGTAKFISSTMVGLLWTAVSSMFSLALPLWSWLQGPLLSLLLMNRELK